MWLLSCGSISRIQFAHRNQGRLTSCSRVFSGSTGQGTDGLCDSRGDEHGGCPRRYASWSGSLLKRVIGSIHDEVVMNYDHQEHDTDETQDLISGSEEDI